MYAAAIDFRPKLLARARNLCGGRWSVDAEDLVGDAYLTFFTKPPEPRTASQLLNWFRTVMRNRNARRFREFDGEPPPESLDAIEERRARRD